VGGGGELPLQPDTVIGIGNLLELVPLLATCHYPFPSHPQMRLSRHISVVQCAPIYKLLETVARRAAVVLIDTNDRQPMLSPRISSHRADDLAALEKACLSASGLLNLISGRAGVSCVVQPMNWA
jgi:hypothetical protein